MYGRLDELVHVLARTRLVEAMSTATRQAELNRVSKGAQAARETSSEVLN